MNTESSNWVNVTAATEKQRLEELEAWFLDAGALSVTLEAAGDMPIFEPLPGEQPLWDQLLVTGLFEAGLDLERLTNLLGVDGFQLCSVTSLADRAWEREWLNRFQPLRFGKRLWICPTGFDLEPAGKVVVCLDPGLAFGTGTHETTRLCLEYLDALPSLEGMKVVDYGCGSGILGIAAAKLGAAEIACVDRDPQALTATRDNAARNCVVVKAFLPNEFMKSHYAESGPESADLLLANILAQPLAQLAPGLLGAVRPGGHVVLSGILRDQAEVVMAAYRRGAELLSSEHLNDWLRLVWRKT